MKDRRVVLFNRLRSRKGGLTVLEYSVLLVALVTGIFLTHAYVRRAVERKWREAADQIGMGLQYQTDEHGAPVTTVIKH